ncbi:MAG: hypothetical protein KDC92_03175 [Bacteroidetes bacterium]|nr:hypothetical protein [Bacteroidota bacterium]
MKKGILAIVLLLWTGIELAAQDVSYQILEDSANRIENTYVTFYELRVDMSAVDQSKWHKGFAGIGSELQVQYALKPNFGIDAIGTYYWFGDKRLGTNMPFRLDIGVWTNNEGKYKTQEIKVPLRLFKTKANVEDDKGRWLGTVDAIGLSYITVEAQKLFQTGLRGGLTMRRATYRPMVDSKYQLGIQNVLGMYGGVQFTRKAHVVTQLEHKVAVSAEYMKWYLDLMYFPIASTTTVDINNRKRLGYRFGVWATSPGMKGLFAKTVYNVELGRLPLDGWYVSLGLGWRLYKSH